MTRLKKELDDRGILQKEFAEQVGATEVSICRYCKGERRPRVDAAIRMAKALNMTVEELFREDIS